MSAFLWPTLPGPPPVIGELFHVSGEEHRPASPPLSAALRPLRARKRWTPRMAAELRRAPARRSTGIGCGDDDSQVRPVIMILYQRRVKMSAINHVCGSGEMFSTLSFVQSEWRRAVKVTPLTGSRGGLLSRCRHCCFCAKRNDLCNKLFGENLLVIWCSGAGWLSPMLLAQINVW